MTSGPRGFDVLHHPALNKGTAFDEDERDRLGLRGLLPSRPADPKVQRQRVLANLERKAYDIERYIFLQALQGRNERLFYQTVIESVDAIMPLIYTPTVGQACKEFAHIFREPRGFYVCPSDRGRIRENLDNWPCQDVRVVVVTDGERILGLGDLGSNGMGIPIGKLALYTAFAGIPPEQCLPVMLDVGTNNEELCKDPLYLGVQKPRLTGDDYLALVEELVVAVQDAFPKALIQFEDFLTPNAYRLLNRYRDRVLCFNDDIQGTAAVSLAGVLATCRVTNREFRDSNILFLGAGSAATGIADLMAQALEAEGLDRAEALRRLWFVDVNGLVVKGRDDLMEHNLPYAHEHPRATFLEAIESVRPQILIGATGAPGTFTREVVTKMASINERPVIFALSNPTSRAECTAEQAYEWSEGRAVFASGSPFGTAWVDGSERRPSQANNAYVFPGIGLGAVATECTRISDEMFLAAARALSQLVSEPDLEAGALFPPLREIRDVSLEVAVAVAEEAYSAGLARLERPADLREYLRASMYDPFY